MVRKQVFRSSEHSRESLLSRVKSESDQKKLKFNINHYLVFQNERNLLQELRILVTPDRKQDKVLQDVPLAGVCNGKCIKNHLVGAKLRNVEITGSITGLYQEGKGTVRSVASYVTQTLSKPKLVVKHLKLKVGYLTVTLTRSFIS